MMPAGFAKFLNRMGAARAKYGGVLVKKTEQDNELGIHVVAWLNVSGENVPSATTSAVACARSTFPRITSSDPPTV
jgi:hypothetical protein